MPTPMKFDESNNPTDIPLLRKETHMSNPDRLANPIYEGIDIFRDLFIRFSVDYFSLVFPLHCSPVARCGRPHQEIIEDISSKVASQNSGTAHLPDFFGEGYPG